MKLHVKTTKRSSEENIIPLINIVFLLLVFFLLAGTLTPRPPFELQAVPAGESPHADVPEGALYISPSGAMFYQGRVVRLAELEGAARAGHERSKPLEILMDRRLKAETLFPVMETLARAGITKVRLLSERPNT